MYNYRCSIRRTCGARKSLKREIDWYIRRPMCPGCNKNTLKSVNKKEKLRNKARACDCGEYSHPHSKGCEPWCKFAKIGPQEEDYIARCGK